jgi:hypothetical protein
VSSRRTYSTSTTRTSLGATRTKAATPTSDVSSTYCLHAHDGDDLGLLEHPAPNLERGDVVLLADGCEALVTARVEAQPGPFEALLEVVVSSKRLRRARRVS